jgi:putative restriction endonuclease
MYSKLKLQYYRTALLQTKRGNGKGVFINAKPVLLIAVFDSIERGLIGDNKLLFDDRLKQMYESVYRSYEKERPITPFYKPFFHLQTDGYWHLSWENDVDRKAKSDKYLRENVKYASLDNALWDLLQDAEARNILKETVIKYFLTNNN